MKPFPRLKTIGTALAASLGITAMAAPAAAAPETNSVAIEWRDLNLETKQGRDTLERRIDQAARKACNVDEARSGTRLSAAQTRECYRAAKASANRQVAQLREETRLGG